MRNTNKKGFTVVELVIVIAVIAILAAVLIPTFAGIIHKANIATDTAVAKNLNTAAIAENADTFDEALAAVKEAGYLIANLNAKATDCYFVWEDDSNQFLLYDLKNDKILYSNTAVSGDPDASWCFAVNNSTDESAVQAAHPSATIKKTLASINDLADALAKGGTVYIDESIVLDEDNLLKFDTEGANVTLNMGNSQLSAQGTLENEIPIQIYQGTVTLNGGIVGAMGTNVDIDGKVFATSIRTYDDATVIINNSQLNGTGGLIFCGNNTLNNVKTNTYYYTARNGQTELNNCVSESDQNMALWMTNTISGVGSNGTAKMVVNGGKYSAKMISDKAVVSVLGGTLVLNGNGEYISAEESHRMFYVNEPDAKIIITGGTFDGYTFDELCAGTADIDWADLCVGDYTITTSEYEGKPAVVITK